MLGEHRGDRVGPEPVVVSFDIGDDHRMRRSTSAAAKNAVAVFRLLLALRNSVDAGGERLRREAVALCAAKSRWAARMRMQYLAP